MSPDRPSRPPWPYLLGLVGLIVTAPGLICAAQVRAGHPDVSWLANLSYCLPAFWPWAAAAPLVAWLGRRARLDRRPSVEGLLVHTVGCAGFVLLHLAFFAFWRRVAAPYPTSTDSFLEELVRLGRSLYVHLDVSAYGAILGVWYLFDNYRRLRDRELASSRLEARLAQARFDALRHQLRPHFLFNALNSVSVLIDEDPDAAKRVLLKISALLRQSVGAEDGPIVPLGRELDHVRSYLEIEQARYGERLRVVVDVPDDLLDHPVPHVLLQPLAENAIHHGISPRETGGRIDITARREADASDERLRIEIRDDGVGLPRGADGGPNAGVGLENCAARIAHLYGPAGRLDIEPGPDRNGTRVVLRIPRRSLDRPSLVP